jgi:hypothetical protein
LKLEQEVMLLTAIGLVSNTVVGGLLAFLLLYYNAESTNSQLLQAVTINFLLVAGC